MSMGAVITLVLALAALTLGTEDQTRSASNARRISNHTTTSASTPRIVSRFNHTPVVDSLVPVGSSSSAMPADHQQLTTAIVVFVLAFVGLCSMATATFFFVRYLIRRAAVQRRRQASWILKSGQWNIEPKRTEADDIRTGCSNTSSSFSAYPYPLSEHF